MAAALLGLAVATVGLLAGVWLVFYGVLSVVGVGHAASVAAVAAAVTLLLVGYLEYRQIETIERVADAERVRRETEPELYGLVTRVATQLDVPVPTVAVSERRAPEALAVGFRPSTVHLVVSRGTLDALDDPAEVEAVVAHELAHVANRDAMVMTVVSLPVVLAEGLRSRVAAAEGSDTTLVVPFLLGVVSTVVWTVGRAITARLSRVRERAADRVAAEVTGSPAALASALERLDRDIAATPGRDLRAASGVSSLSILPLEPAELRKVMLGPDGDREPSYWWLRKRLHALERWLFRTHPPTAERIASLRALERDRR
ncbi:M48 family metalloprotease [Halobaculum litoreum]|uniref:M48 family metalloprotease n=1 Tax=Halobaculum litoreum TaxID=3031998 RepID=A0ABD5XRE0_9EURY